MYKYNMVPHFVTLSYEFVPCIPLHYTLHTSVQHLIKININIANKENKSLKKQFLINNVKIYILAKFNK